METNLINEKLSIIKDANFIEMCELFFDGSSFNDLSNNFLNNILLPMINFYTFLQQNAWLNILDAIQKRQINRNQAEYLLLRDRFNEKKDPIDLFLLCCSCAKNKMRLDKNMAFNQNWGNRIFKRSIENKLYDYHRKIYKNVL